MKFEWGEMHAKKSLAHVKKAKRFSLDQKHVTTMLHNSGIKLEIEEANMKFL